jgi:hypothetical protein
MRLPFLAYSIRRACKLTVASLAVTLVACGGGGSSQSGQSTAPVVTTLTVGVIDAQTKASITQVPFTLAYGDDALAALTTQSVTSSSFTNSRIHTLRSDLTPSDSAPVSLSLTLTASGYLPLTKRITLRQTGNTTFLLEAISTAVDAQGRLTSNPIGVNGIKSAMPITAGVVSPGPAAAVKSVDQQLYAGLAGPNTPSTGLSLIMPVGTMLGTLRGGIFTPTANNTMDLILNTFSPYATESLSQFPTSMVGAKVRSTNGIVQNFERVRVDAAVTIVALSALNDHGGDFSLPLEVTIDTPRVAFDDAQREFTELGQTAQVFRFDASTGIWEPATLASVSDLNRGPDTVALHFTASKTGTYAILKRPAACGLELTLLRAASDKRALNVTVLTRGFLDGDEGLTGTFYFNPELPENAGAAYVTLPSGIKVGEAVLPKLSDSESCPRRASVIIN